MMREKVCIVLNEREPNKARAAQALLKRLADHNITASRVPIDENIAETIKLRLPQVLVIDYLLGDYSTGLDILSQLNTLEETQRPKTIFLTDEPSVPVAVEALRIGALNYYELDNPQSVNKITADISELLKVAQRKKPQRYRKALALDDLVAQSRASLKLIEETRLFAARRDQIVVMVGEPGSGLSTLAQALSIERESQSHTEYIDVRSSIQELSDLCGRNDFDAPHLKLGDNLSLIIDHEEEDEGEILEYFSKERDDIWHSRNASNDSFLTICTTRTENAKAWQKLADARIITVPPLAERREDIPALIQRFVREGEELLKEKIKPFSSDIVQLLARMSWPANLRQLRSVVLDAALTSTFSENSLEKIVEETVATWNESDKASASSIPLSPLTAAMMLESSNHNLRICAAKFGCSIQALRELLKGAERA